jgi:hypothetical protein
MMGTPTNFDRSNAVIGPPPGVPETECGSVFAWRGVGADGIPRLATCWKLTAEELAEVKRTGNVWFMMWGVQLVPHWVGGHCPF